MNDFRLILEFRILEWICGEMNESKRLNKRTLNKKKNSKEYFFKQKLK